jgi:hypothetical protein|tara:strand:+ start:585 stop:695 length:111 start_codon:yes stop_codon:yes gene_type:complete
VNSTASGIRAVEAGEYAVVDKAPFGIFFLAFYAKFV